MEKNKYIRVSDSFTIRNDSNGSFLIGIDSPIFSRGIGREITAIPNFAGLIFEKIGKLPYNESLNALGIETGIKPEVIDSFVSQLVDSNNGKQMRFEDGKTVFFPDGTLISSDEKDTRSFFREEGFDWKKDFTPGRPTMPVSVNLMTTTLCSTDCIYCYADKKIGDNLKIDEIERLLEELHRGGAVTVTLTGGDLFAFPEWKRLLSAVREYRYLPYISTKTTLDYDGLMFLKNSGYDEFQFSLDSNIPSKLSELLRIDGSTYIKKVSRMLTECSDIGLDVKIRSVLTSINSDEDHILGFYDFLKDHPCIKAWDMTPAFFSEYKSENYKNLVPENENLKKINNFANGEHAFPIHLNKIGNEGYMLQRFSDVDDFVCRNQICLANYYGLSILADGNCSLCEMLYRNPEFLLGNVRNQTVREIWNSEKALHLYSPKQEDMNEDSPCRVCRVFEKCKVSSSKRVCYLNIHKTGGTMGDPDPSCPMAPHTDLML